MDYCWASIWYVPANTLVLFFLNLPTNSDLAFSGPRSWAEIGFDGNSVFMVPWEHASLASFITQMHTTLSSSTTSLLYIEKYSRSLNSVCWLSPEIPVDDVLLKAKLSGEGDGSHFLLSDWGWRRSTWQYDAAVWGEEERGGKNWMVGGKWGRDEIMRQ